MVHSLICPYTLRFSDKQLEKEFNEVNSKRFYRQQRLGVLLAFIVMGIITTFDILVFGLNFIRSIVDFTATVFLVCLNIAFFVKQLRIYITDIAGFVFFLWSGANCLTGLETDGLFADASASTACLVFLFMITVLRAKFIHVIVYGSILFIYDIILLQSYYRATMPWYESLFFTFNLLGIVILGVSGCYSMEIFLRHSLVLQLVVEIETQKAKNEQAVDNSLLENIFTQQVSNTLQELAETHSQQGSRNGDLTICHSHPSVSVLFIDIVGFTEWSSQITPQEMVMCLNEIFSRMDEIVERHEFEKVKTLGDAYLCVGNMSFPIEDHEMKAIALASELVRFVESGSHQTVLRSVHVGIGSGPIIAGVTGLSKWNYDIFGKTFEHTLLAEAVCPPNNIVMTEAVYDKVKSEYACTEFERKLTDSTGETFTVYKCSPSLLPISTLSASFASGSPPVAESASLLEFEYTTPFKPTMFFSSDVSAQAKKYQIPSKAEQSKLEGASIGIAESEYHAYIKDVVGPVSKSPKLTERAPKLSDLKNKNDVAGQLQSLRDELKTFKKRFGFMQFSPQLEKEFWRDVATKSRSHTTRTVLCGGILAFLWLLMSVLSGGIIDLTPNNSYLLVTEILLVLVFVGFYFFTKSRFFLRSYSKYIIVAFLIVGGSFLVISELPATSTIYYIIRPALYLYYCFFFICFPIYYLFVVAAAISIAGVLLTLKVGSTGLLITLFLVYLCTNITACIANMSSESELRMQFVLLKITKLELQQQQDSKDTVKLLLDNILPQYISQRLATQMESSFIVDYFDNATIMFVTISNFSKLTANLTPTQTFSVLNRIKNYKLLYYCIITIVLLLENIELTTKNNYTSK